MDVIEVNNRFREKINKNYKEHIAKLQTLSAAELIEKAEEIAAFKIIYNKLSTRSFSTGDINYMLNFKKPLDIILEEYRIYYSDLPYDHLQYVLWNINDKQKYKAKFETEG